MAKELTQPKLSEQYKKDCGTVQMYNNATEKWFEAIYRIKTTQSYLEEGLPWGKWCEKYCDWTTPKRISRMINYESKTLSKYAGEAVHKNSSSNYQINKPNPILGLDKDSDSENNSNLSPPKRSHYYVDNTGHPVPDELEELWLRVSEMEAFARKLDELEREVENIESVTVETKDKLWMQLGLGSLKIDLHHLAEKIRAAKPYAVCPSCQGKTKDQCTNCKGQGFINKLNYTVATPKELRSIRELAAKSEHAKLQTKGLSARSH